MRLVVFFSRGMSLDAWRRAGILDRELALYRGLQPHLEHLAFVTYGGAEDLRLAREVPGVEILPNRWGLPANLYSVVAPILHRRPLARATIFKTNQINGAWCAVIAKRLFRKKLVVRCGFLWSDFVARLHAGTWRARLAALVERWIFRAADLAISAGPADRQAVIDRYAVDAGRVQVIPNYVDTDAFKPRPEVTPKPGRVIFIGRLVDQKNLLALVEAMEGVPGVSMTVIGDGPLREAIQTSAARRGVDVSFLGTRPHTELPRLLNESALFVLPSHYEGNPKALLEAMACGVPVVGTSVPGIRDILIDGETGRLCGTSAAEIRTALQEVLGNPALRERIAAGAVAYVRERCSVQAVVDLELAILRSLETEGRVKSSGSVAISD